MNIAILKFQGDGRMTKIRKPAKKTKRKNKSKTSGKKQIIEIKTIFKISLVILIIIIAILVFRTKLGNKTETGLANKQTTKFKEIVREPAISGSWYPRTKEAVINEIETFFKNNKEIQEINNTISKLKKENIFAIIVPHAGWRFSGQTASTAFNTICNKSYQKVFILAPSHYASFRGISVGNFTHYRTPLGKIEVSNIVKELLKKPLFTFVPEMHSKEHAIEIELPFLQYCLNDFEIVPLLVGNLNSYADLQEIAKTLNEYIDNDSLIVVSSDFTHYGANYGYLPFTDNVKENIKKLDLQAFESIKSKDALNFYNFIQRTQDTICGRNPIILLLNIIKDKQLNTTLIKYDASGNILNDFTNSVSYMAIAFSNPEDSVIELTPEEKEFLLKLARETIETYLATGGRPKVDKSQVSDKLKQKMGCFVTLEKNGMLRGCIGHILPQEELYKCVMDNAINAAVNDPRFNPVSTDELKDITIEISALSVPTRLTFSSPEDLKNKLIPNVHGVILKRGFRQSTYLPQVWEQLPDKESFLTQLCIKGGMNPYCWKDSSTEVYVYRAHVFSENKK